MVNAMTNLYFNSQKREQLSREGIKHAMKFNWDTTVAQIFDLK